MMRTWRRKSVRTAFLTSLAGVALSANPVGAANLTLVADGKPNAVIIVEADAPKAQSAAEALQTYIERMSGASLPLVAEGDVLPADAPPVRVHVGHSSAARGQKVPAGFDTSVREDTFEEEGYVLRTLDANTLLVAGNNDGPYKGTIFAAYALLERLGCRFYFPGDWGEIVPKLTTVVVPELDVLSRPDFAVRGIWLGGGRPGITPQGARDYGAWLNKVGFGSSMYPGASDGSLGALVPVGQYAEEHPEYYAIDQQGRRQIPPLRKPSGVMLCFSHPDVPKVAIETLKMRFADPKNAASLGAGFSPPDGMPFCYCPDCEKAAQNFLYPSYFPKRMMSEEYCGFAAKIAAAFPDKFISLSAYVLREVPPQGVALPPNIAVQIWPIGSCVLHAGDDPACWRRRETMSIIRGWRKLTPHVMIQHYTPGLLSIWGAGHQAHLPERDVTVFAAEAPLLLALGIKGSNSQGASAFMSTWLSYYVRAKLLWDATTDVNALKTEFYDTFFGPAAGPHVRAWWDACEDALGQATVHVHEDWLVNHVYSVPFTSKIHAHVQAALAADVTPEQRARLDAFALIADHLEAYAAMNEAESRLDYPQALAAAERMFENLEKLRAIYSLFVYPPSLKSRIAVNRLKGPAAKTDGTTGTLIAPLPLDMKFARDRFNEGVLAEWQAPDFDDARWEMKNTFYTWDQQDAPESPAGHDYDGHGWYRADLDVAKKWVGKPVRLHIVGAINEAWVWINGQYAGHRKHLLWWSGSHAVDLDVTGLVRPGERNTVAIRVWNDAEPGGIYRRGFLYSPVETQDN
jgi:hypothetical protein